MLRNTGKKDKHKNKNNNDDEVINFETHLKDYANELTVEDYIYDSD